VLDREDLHDLVAVVVDDFDDDLTWLRAFERWLTDLTSGGLRDVFGNEDEFYARAGTEIALPERKLDRPGSEFLQWHLETVFDH
jgi:hypothetical protein